MKKIRFEHIPESHGIEDRPETRVLTASSWDGDAVARAEKSVTPLIEAELRPLPVAVEIQMRREAGPLGPDTQAPYIIVLIKIPMSVYDQDMFERYQADPGLPALLRLIEERIADRLAAFNLEPGLLSRPNPEYRSPFRAGRRVRVRYGEHLGRSGVISGESAAPNVHWISLDGGPRVEIGDDLYVFEEDAGGADFQS